MTALIKTLEELRDNVHRVLAWDMTASVIRAVVQFEDGVIELWQVTP